MATQNGSNKSGSNKKVANRLVALSATAVLAVYSAGYVRTRDAEDRFALRAAERRPSAQRTANIEAGSAEPVPTATVERHAAVRDSAVPSATQVTPATKASIADTPATAVVVPDTTPTTPTPPAVPNSPIPVAVVVAPTPGPVPDPKPAEPAPPPKPEHEVWKDGTFLGWGTSRHGDIQASVVIDGGRIVSATIAQCLTRYACDVIDHLPPQVIKRQSSDVDTVSRATESADAFYFAVVDALKQAK